MRDVPPLRLREGKVGIVRGEGQKRRVRHAPGGFSRVRVLGKEIDMNKPRAVLKIDKKTREVVSRYRTATEAAKDEAERIAWNRRATNAD